MNILILVLTILSLPVLFLSISFFLSKKAVDEASGYTYKLQKPDFNFNYFIFSLILIFSLIIIIKKEIITSTFSTTDFLFIISVILSVCILLKEIRFK